MGYYQILHGLSPCPHWNGRWRVKSFRHAQISYQSSWLVLSHEIYEISHKHQMFPMYTMIEDYMYLYYTVGGRWILTESGSLAPALPSVQWYRPWPVGPHLHLKDPQARRAGKSCDIDMHHCHVFIYKYVWTWVHIVHTHTYMYIYIYIYTYIYLI